LIVSLALLTGVLVIIWYNQILADSVYNMMQFVIGFMWLA